MTKNNIFGRNLIWRMAKNDNFGGNLIWRISKNINFGGKLSLIHTYEADVDASAVSMRRTINLQN